MSSITPIVMPKWGLSMREGTVNAWLVEEGAAIKVGDEILEVETDKIAGAVEAADPGTLRRRVAEPGQTLPVKALLGVMAEKSVTDAEIDQFVSAYVVPVDEDGEEGEAASAYQFVDVDDIRIRYAKKGSGGETVLLIHGFGGDLDNWLFNIDALAEKHSVFALDLPAHGQSTPKLPGARLRDLATFVARFMEAVGIGRAHLVGHSLGAAIAAQLALDQPDKVASVAAIGGAGFGDDINTDYTSGFVNAPSRRELKPVIEQLFSDANLVSRQMLDDLLKYKRLDGVSEALAELAAGVFAGGRQVDQPGQRLGVTGKRVLAVWGNDDRIIPAAHAQNVPAGSAVKVIAGAGHMVQMEKASEVNQLLKAHISG